MFYSPFFFKKKKKKEREKERKGTKGGYGGKEENKITATCTLRAVVLAKILNLVVVHGSYLRRTF